MTRRILALSLGGLFVGTVSGYAFKSLPIPSRVLQLALAIGFAAGIPLFWMLVSRLLAARCAVSLAVAFKQSFWPVAAFVLLPVQYAPFLLYQASGDDSVLRPISTSWQILLVLIISLALVFTLLAYRFGFVNKGPLAAISRHPWIFITVMLALWVAGTSTLDILKTHYMNKTGFNTPIFVDSLHNIFSGNGPLYSTLFMANGSSLLGIHASFIWYIVFPFFRIWPTYPWLLILSNLALGLTAIPIYVLARRYFAVGTCLLLVLLFLFNRIVIVQPAISDLSEERFLPVLFVSAFLFWQMRRYWLFLAFAALTISVREDMAIVIVLLGVISLLMRRSLKWWLVPTLLAGVWFGVAMGWLIPAMNPVGDSTTRAVVRYSSLGSNTHDVITTLFFHPWQVLRLAFSSSRHLGTWYGLFLSFGFGVPLLSGMLLLGLPAVGESFLLAQPGLNIFNMLAVAAPLFPALIISLNRFDGIVRRRWKFSIATALVILSLFSTLSLSYTWLNPNWYTPRYNYTAAENILSEIPANAKVILPDFMAALAQPGQDVRGYYQVPWEVETTGRLTVEQDYIVVDENPPKQWGDSRYVDGLNILKDNIEQSNDFQIAFDSNDLRLYVRKGATTQTAGL